MEQALHLRQRLASLLDALGLQPNPTKGFWVPCGFGKHLEAGIDPASGMFYALADKLDGLFRQATRLIGHATRNASCMKQYFHFCEDERRPALAADPGTMARYVMWLENLGTIKASSLQSYMSAVNNFFKDHGREPMALGGLASRARKGLAAS
eukprot:jgi/Tetstr1/456822/TSEL_043496.t1